MTSKIQKILDDAVGSLRAQLGENLLSCCLYGSAVRGNFVEGVSDLNLLILLNNSTAEAHEQIARAIGNQPQIDPFILGKRGFARSVRAFATKFASIQRNYRVLHGADPLSDFQLDPNLEKFLCEQAVRNLRLRMIYAFVTRSRNKAYDRFVLRNITTMLVQFSEALRLTGISVPAAIEERVPIFEKQFGIDAQVLRDLLAFRTKPARWSDAEAETWHQRLFPVVDAVLAWIETRWETPVP
ncbi:MAG TPA: hypothetical protein VGR78_03155 [Verrucomicrobiae bacterium]|nr:hypothetical protein [Verrucomicrobiae bacterium]